MVAIQDGLEAWDKGRNSLLSMAAWRCCPGADLPCRWSRFDTRLSCFFSVVYIFSFSFPFLCDKRICNNVVVTLAHSSTAVHALCIEILY